MRTLSLCLICVIWGSGIGTDQGAEAPEIPRIDSVVMTKPQLHETSEAVIWYDDFDGEERKYPESSGGLDEQQVFGGQGKSMLCLYEKDSRGVGGRKVFFGDSPVYSPVNSGKQYDDIYWRIYVKHQYGWTGAAVIQDMALTPFSWKHTGTADRPLPNPGGLTTLSSPQSQSGQ